MDPPPPAWMLLDEEVDVDDDDRGNATTAEVQAGYGRTVKVSVFAAAPPRLSHVGVHCPGLTKESGFCGTPSVLQSLGGVALIKVAFSSLPKYRYFLYRAGRGRRPSLQLLGEFSRYVSGIRAVASIGFVPDGDGFVLAALSYTRITGLAELHVFRTSNVEKVIALGGGELAFVDIWKGALVCDVLSEQPTTRLIPMPRLLPGNKVDGKTQASSAARQFRNVAFCSDGLIRCVEVEDLFTPCITQAKPKSLSGIPDDVSKIDVLQDKDLISYCPESPKEEVTYEYAGWRVIVWSRGLFSTCWTKDCKFRADDIVSARTSLTREHCCRGPPEFAPKDLVIYSPILGLDGTTLYLISKVISTNQELVTRVDMREKVLEEVLPVLTRRPDIYRPSYIACDLCPYI
ncbi:hypothetical protein ACP4OV_005260 [Aristida adscensionis]